MKIRLRQSGGFAGLVRGCDVDTTLVEPKAAKDIEAAAARCLISPGLSKAVAADVFVYEIRVAEDNQDRLLKCDDGTMTAELHQLIEQLSKYVKPVRLE